VQVGELDKLSRLEGRVRRRQRESRPAPSTSREGAQESVAGMGRVGSAATCRGRRIPRSRSPGVLDQTAAGVLLGEPSLSGCREIHPSPRANRSSPTRRVPEAKNGNGWSNMTSDSDVLGRPWAFCGSLLSGSRQRSRTASSPRLDGLRGRPLRLDHRGIARSSSALRHRSLGTRPTSGPGSDNTAALTSNLQAPPC